MCIGAIQGGFFNLKISLPAAVGLGVAGDIYMSHYSNYYICVLILLYMCHYCGVCVLIFRCLLQSASALQVIYNIYMYIYIYIRIYIYRLYEASALQVIYIYAYSMIPLIGRYIDIYF